MTDLTSAQWSFLAGLRHGPHAATADQDASVIGPLIRSELVDWSDDVIVPRNRRMLPSATFTLTPRGAAHLVKRQADAFSLR